MRTAVVVSVLTVSAFMGPSAWGQLHDHIVDQYQEDWNFCYNVGGETKMAQTFMTDLENVALCHVEIGLPDWSFGTVSGLFVQIYQGQPGTGWTDPLASFTLGTPPGLPYDDVFDNYRATSPTLYVPLTADTIYSIVVSPEGGTAYVGTTNYESYDAGALWANYDGTWLLSETDTSVYDMQFRTYVVPVPLPAGVWLGICAMGVAGWHLKRHMT